MLKAVTSNDTAASIQMCACVYPSRGTTNQHRSSAGTSYNHFSNESPSLYVCVSKQKHNQRRFDAETFYTRLSSDSTGNAYEAASSRQRKKYMNSTRMTQSVTSLTSQNRYLFSLIHVLRHGRRNAARIHLISVGAVKYFMKHGNMLRGISHHGHPTRRL